MKKNYKMLVASLFAIGINSAIAQCPVPTLVTASPSVICAGATTSLNATALGYNINWFTTSVGGATVGTSSSGTNIAFTPTINTTYYAESYAISSASTQVYSYTGSMQTFTVPVGVTTVTIITKGAQGQKATTTTSLPGNGGIAKGVLTVTPGQVLNVFVGGQTGYNGGGAYWGNPGLTCMGGGASDVRYPGVTLTDRIIVAGAGGGVSGESAWGNGGHGGGGIAVGSNFVGGQGGAGYLSVVASPGATSGGAATTNTHGGPGGGGGLTSGGAGATSTGYGGAVAGTGALGVGGFGLATASGCCQLYGCAGGGGGYYGGGGVAGGCCGGGGAGGGSSWTGTLASPSFTSGTQIGNGEVSFIWLPIACTSISRTPVTVTVGSIPTISVTSGAICAGSSYTMLASGAGSYTYSSGSAVVTPSANTSYSVTGTSTLGCVGSNTAVSSVTVNANPTVVASTSNTLICSGESVVLTASTSATSYTWNTGATTMSVSVSPSVTSIYTVNVSNAATCVASSTVMVTVNACTGINEILANSISVYPNPAIGVINVDLTSELSKRSSIEIYDAVGKLVVKQNLNSEINTINITVLNTGVYTFKILNNSETIKTGKFIKQ
jgi:hypothetical protein